ncbi:MAG: flagellar protein FliS [Pirellulaceae bacterium]
MKPKNLYKTDSNFAGASRISLLIKVYDRTLGFIEMAHEANLSGDNDQMLEWQLKIQRMILGLLAGIDTDSGDVAVNVARLLEFVMDRVVHQDFEAAHKITNKLRDTYTAVQEEVEELESSGAIPSMPSTEKVELSV